MYIYIIAFILSTFFIKYAKKYNIKYSYALKDMFCSQAKRNDYKLKYYVFFVLAFIPLFFISAFRYNVGTDYMYTYYPNFYSILNGNREYSEIGFYLLNKLIQLFTSKSLWLFIVTSFIFVYCLLKCIIKYSDKPILSMVVVFLTMIFFVSLNNVRQSIAAIIMLLAFDALCEKKTLKYILYVFIALIFHYSAIIMLIFYLFTNIKFIRKHFLLVSLILLLGIPVIAKIGITIILNTKYAYFLSSHFNNGQVTIVNIVYGLILFISTYYFFRKDLKSDRKSYILVCSQLFYFLISLLSLFIKVSELISRLSFYYLLFQVILIPYLVVKQKNNEKKYLIIFAYLVMYVAYFYYYIILKGYHGVLPYQFIF